MKIYCKRQPTGVFLTIPDSWKIHNYRYYGYKKGFVPIEELNGHLGRKLLYFIGIWDRPETIEEMCNTLFNSVPLIQSNFWLVYYYSYDNVCVLAAEENYFEGSDYDVVEVDLKGVTDEGISKQNT